jgi:hypothetical protein
MDAMTPEQFRELVDHTAPGTLSIVCPTSRRWPGTDEDPIRFKNLLGEAEERLTEHGMRSADARDRLAPARDLLDEEDFWQHLDRALVMYFGPESDTPRVYRIPVPVEPLVTVGEHFYAKPLVPLAMQAETFYVLAFSQKQVRFFRATPYGMAQSDLPEAPESIGELTRVADPERSLQFHTGTGGEREPADREAVFHGHGVGTDEAVEKKRVLEFCQAVADAVASRLAESHAPLVLATHEPLLGLYREANHYPHLVESVASVDPDLAGPDDIHAAASEAVEPVLEASRKKAAGRYHDLLGTGLASAEPETVLVAGLDRRIDTLWIRADRRIWGRFDAEDRGVTIHKQREAGDEELSNRAVVEAGRGDARIYRLGGERMPDEAPLAALFRYPAPT